MSIAAQASFCIFSDVGGVVINTARVHNGSKFGGNSAGSSVSTDWTACTFHFQLVQSRLKFFEAVCSWWGHFTRTDFRRSSFAINNQFRRHSLNEWIFICSIATFTSLSLFTKYCRTVCRPDIPASFQETFPWGSPLHFLSKIIIVTTFLDKQC